MQLSNTSQYAIRILSYIANNKILHSAKNLSVSLNIPYKFLTKIMTDLVKAGFIISIRGREGGYKLAKSASSIRIIEILNFFNEFKDYDKCILGIGKCDGKNKCIMHDKWKKPKCLIYKMFKETTLENLEGDEFKIK